MNRENNISDAFKKIYEDKKTEDFFKKLGESLWKLGEYNTPYKDGKPVNVLKPKKDGK